MRTYWNTIRSKPPSIKPMPKFHNFIQSLKPYATGLFPDPPTKPDYPNEIYQYSTQAWGSHKSGNYVMAYIPKVEISGTPKVIIYLHGFAFGNPYYYLTLRGCLRRLQGLPRSKCLLQCLNVQLRFKRKMILLRLKLQYLQFDITPQCCKKMIGLSVNRLCW